jgi:cytochrome c oxidase subunit 4
VADSSHKNDDAHDSEGVHAHGVGRYWLVWGALILGTILTVITGRRDLGVMNLPLAMTIATVKASLVVLFFMHMTETPTANRIVFGASLVFAIVLIIGVFGDLWTRNEMTLPTVAPTGPELVVPSMHGEPAPAHAPPH